MLAIPGVFTLARVFFVRDLTTTFLPHHLWFHQSLLAGWAPIWNPYPGFGCSTVSDPTFQTLFPLTLPLRLLPATLGFNLIVALPFPLAAVGMYSLLRARVTALAACLGAITVAASGAFLSTANTPNLAWSVALIPWVLLATDRLAARPSRRAVATLAAALALMFLAGEPVTFAATAVLALAFAAVAGAAGSAGWRPARAAVVATLAALACAALLSAIQILPLLDAHSRSIRAAGSLVDMWSLHPARLIELVAPWFFGKWVGMPDEITRWLLAVNDGREPLLMSLYLGAVPLLLAVLGVASKRHRRAALFCCVVLVAGLVAALGTHTPIHSAAQRVFPILSNLRFPSKHFVFVALALGALAALGFDELARRPAVSRRRLAGPVVLAAMLTVAATTGVVLAFALPQTGLALGERLARAAAIADPSSAAGSLLGRLGAGSIRLLVLAVVAGAALLLAATSRPAGRFARYALFVLLAGDLIVTNASINPTIEAAALAPFDWVKMTTAHPQDRVYVARNFGAGLAKLDDALPSPAFSTDVSPTVHQALFDTALCDYWSCWDVRKTLTRDLTGLRPREYLTLLERFSASDRALRYRFLSWAGTRYYLAGAAPPLPAAELLHLPKLGPTTLYESAPSGSRVAVLAEALVEPDADAQVARLFDPGFDPAQVVVIDREPAPSGRRGDPAPPAASIVKESTASVSIEAAAAEDSYLVLLDAYDPGWRVEVDGESGSVVRANGMFRAVRIPPGRHEVRFSYLPRALLAGAAISAVTGLGLLALAWSGRPS